MRRHPPQALRGQNADQTIGHRRQPAAHQHQRAIARRSPGRDAKDQEGQPQQNIDPDLGHYGEHRRDRGGPGHIGRGQPEGQRPDPGLDQKGHRHDPRPGMKQSAFLLAQTSHHHRQMRHVQRAGRAVDQADPDQEQQRAGQVHRDVMQPRPHPQLAPAMQQKAIGRGQQNLEKHEQVEQIAGQEGPVQPHQQELQHRVEMLPLPVPARRRIGQDRQRQQAGQHQHHRRQPVDHQHDPERRGPVAHQVEADVVAAGQLAALGPHQKLDRGDEGCRHRQQPQHQLGPPLPFVIDQHQRAREERDQDRRDDQVFGRDVHGSRSCPSTWSVPVNPREAIRTTRNSAVVAKLITMAVSTSACGTGSAKAVGSIGP